MPTGEEGPDPRDPVPVAPAPAPASPIPEEDDRGVRYLPEGAPATKYLTLDRAACEAELEKRKIAFVRASPTQGVLIPVRLKGAVSGVAIHSTVPAGQRHLSKYEVFDCRLVLALDDFAQVLGKHGIVDVVHYAAYRPKSENGCTAKYAGKQHCAALALDVGIFTKKDGAAINVERHFHGRIGDPTCTATAAPKVKTPESTMLWSIVCEAAQKGIFNVILTPNYNAQHVNHFHVEITPDANWQMIR
jgi:hypothetical protein